MKRLWVYSSLVILLLGCQSKKPTTQNVFNSLESSFEVYLYLADEDNNEYFFELNNNICYLDIFNKSDSVCNEKIKNIKNVSQSLIFVHNSMSANIDFNLKKNITNISFEKNRKVKYFYNVHNKMEYVQLGEVNEIPCIYSETSSKHPTGIKNCTGSDKIKAKKFYTNAHNNFLDLHLSTVEFIEFIEKHYFKTVEI